MTIAAVPGKLHWNYFLTLERDMEVLSRYVEFDPRNLNVFSIELAHLLFAAASEVDVVAKLLCECVNPGAPARNIDEYKAILTTAFPSLPREIVNVPRYGMEFKPWEHWGWHAQPNPDWWRSYNNVKHERDGFFHEATLQHALNAMGALLILNFHFYSRKLADPGNPPLDPKPTTGRLQPAATLFSLDPGYYHTMLVI